LLINRIDQHPLGGQIFHVTVDGLRIVQPQQPGGLLTRMAHLPITLPTLQHSGLSLLEMRQPDPEYMTGYEQWKQAFDAGNAGAFGNTLAAIATIIEKQLNGIPNVPPPGYRQ
jgi:cyclopropane fatty-acyl-phospholipid synthase-like methyltransferase